MGQPEASTKSSFSSLVNGPLGYATLTALGLTRIAPHVIPSLNISKSRFYWQAYWQTFRVLGTFGAFIPANGFANAMVRLRKGADPLTKEKSKDWPTDLLLLLGSFLTMATALLSVMKDKYTLPLFGITSTVIGLNLFQASWRLDPSDPTGWLIERQLWMNFAYAGILVFPLPALKTAGKGLMHIT